MARTNPIGVRFDPEKLEFIKQREKLQSNQQIVDLLVNRYWWEHKMPIPTHKESPPLSLKNEFNTPELPQSFYHEPQTEGKSVEQHLKEIANLDTPYEYEQKAKEIKSDSSLTDRERKDLLLNMTLPKN